MKGNNWEYDTVYFVGQIRRSGGSLVITIPNELRNRFLINEGQKVWIIGVTRRRPQGRGWITNLPREILRNRRSRRI